MRPIVVWPLLCVCYKYFGFLSVCVVSVFLTTSVENHRLKTDQALCSHTFAVEYLSNTRYLQLFYAVIWVLLIYLLSEQNGMFSPIFPGVLKCKELVYTNERGYATTVVKSNILI